jgi:hypothetical protein
MRKRMISLSALCATSALCAAGAMNRPATEMAQPLSPMVVAHGQTLGVASAALIHWYRPPDAACPVYTFDPSVAGSDVAAKQTCEQRTSKICVSSVGSSPPAC